MRTKLFNALKVSTLALLLSFGLSFVYAWTAPTISAPGGNVSAPINTSSTGQTKLGSFVIGDIVTPKALTVYGTIGVSGDIVSLGTTTTTRLKVLNGAGTAGQVLTSDASGNASWVATSSPVLGLSRGGGAQTCPSGQVVIGINQDGTHKCSTTCTISTVYQHPAKTCTNGTDSCTIPASADTTTQSTDWVYQGCSLGYFSGTSYCWGNSINGVCPGTGAFATPALGNFDFAVPRVSGSHEAGVGCSPANIQVQAVKCL